MIRNQMVSRWLPQSTSPGKVLPRDLRGTSVNSLIIVNEIALSSTIHLAKESKRELIKTDSGFNLEMGFERGFTHQYHDWWVLSLGRKWANSQKVPRVRQDRWLMDVATDWRTSRQEEGETTEKRWRWTRGIDWLCLWIITIIQTRKVGKLMTKAWKKLSEK